LALAARGVGILIRGVEPPDPPGKYSPDVGLLKTSKTSDVITVISAK